MCDHFSHGVIDCINANTGLDFTAPAPAMAPTPLQTDPFAQPAAAAPAAPATPKDDLANALGGGLVNLDGLMQVNSG